MREDLARGDPSHPGKACIVRPIDNFQIKGQTRMFACFVYKPARGTVRSVQSRLPDGKVPVDILKPWLYSTLQGLDYLHASCHGLQDGKS